jgi:Initiation factor 2 subunit family
MSLGWAWWHPKGTRQPLAAFADLHLLPQVLVGAHTLLANGGIIAPAGTALVALAAKKHAVPLVVLVVSRRFARHKHTCCFRLARHFSSV